MVLQWQHFSMSRQDLPVWTVYVNGIGQRNEGTYPPPPTTVNPQGESMKEVQDNTHGSGDVRLRKKKAPIRMENIKQDGNAKIGRIVALRPPKAGIQCTGRNDTTRLLWLHEYYVVHEGTSRKGNNYIYQAVQFAVGEHVPVDEVHNMTDRMRRSIWVQGRCHLPAEHVRRFSKRNCQSTDASS